MLVRTQLSVLTGIAVWAFALLTGLELAAAWGIIAFALNYIPFLGPFVATNCLLPRPSSSSWQSIMLSCSWAFSPFSSSSAIISNRLSPAPYLPSPRLRAVSGVLLELLVGHSRRNSDRRARHYRHLGVLAVSSSRWIATLLSGKPQSRVSE